ncbi:DUF6463 family protein [Spirillospora sp. CA-294931]|uniref:DUF6463 family protein n=1 Tax=Spirillospora sp. CA-294931 TaxID=3240042 RepID=UPI003D8B4350
MAALIAFIGLHFAIAIVGWSTFGDIARDGFWDTVPGKPQREHELWYFLAGFGMLALGTMSKAIVDATGRIPAQLGWYLLAVGVPLQILFPLSGAPGLILLGVLALVASRKEPALTR